MKSLDLICPARPAVVRKRATFPWNFPIESVFISFHFIQKRFPLNSKHINSFELSKFE